MAAAELAQCLSPAQGQLPWRVVRPAGTIPQTGAPVTAEAMQPFVARGAGDAEAATELRKEFALLKGSEGETFTDRNQRASKPRHARSVRHPKASECPRCLGLALSTMSCHRAVDLRNSGDTAGPRSEVVGYGAFVFEGNWLNSVAAFVGDAE
jgi:hypothetical protein